MTLRATNEVSAPKEGVKETMLFLGKIVFCFDVFVTSVLQRLVYGNKTRTKLHRMLVCEGGDSS